MGNMDLKTVQDFGAEWTSFDQSRLTEQELEDEFNTYFEIFPWQSLPSNALGFDLGCGSGRWAKFVAPRVLKLYCIDASEAAIKVAKRTLKAVNNCEFHVASIDRMPIPDGSMDFGYTLGVLHTLPDPCAGLRSCVAKLKPHAPLLIYTYYALENRPFWFRTIWKMTDLARRVISRMPHPVKHLVTSAIAVLVYWPFARLSFVCETFGFDVRNIPLSAYRARSLYTMRTDALDRFGTRIEHRFTRDEIRSLMKQAGLEQITFGRTKFWCAVGYKKPQ